ncbi:arginase family protein [Paractinoplanes hotanensis]|uniref:arginase family protein n=1 Tax=Paractinoplanes hotanensis TaxID=2906497 RepID=UPI0034DB317A
MGPARPAVLGRRRRGGRGGPGRRRYPLVVVTGGCVTALGIVVGLQRAGTDPGIAWFDAHSDVQTLETTAFGYLPGMSLRMLTGYRPELIAERATGGRAGSPAAATTCAHLPRRASCSMLCRQWTGARVKAAAPSTEASRRPAGRPPSDCREDQDPTWMPGRRVWSGSCLRMISRVTGAVSPRPRRK